MNKKSKLIVLSWKFLSIFLAFFLSQKIVISANSDHFSKRFNISDNRKIYLKCSGKGSPTVILESGYRNDSDVWTHSAKGKEAVFPAIAAFTRVCAYDRPGTIGLAINDHSRSDAIGMPRRVETVVEDLHSLLQKAKVPGPYILVGHSLGGIFVRLYASKYPKEVAGLVLVDAYPESFRSLLGEKNWQDYLKIINPAPPGIKDPNFEFIDFDKATNLMEQVSKRSPLQQMPLIVLSRGQAADLPSSIKTTLTQQGLEKAWQAGQTKLVALLPDSQQIIATKSQHYIQYQQPELVIAAIRMMVNKIHGR